MILIDVINKYSELLKTANIDTAVFDCKLLLSYVLGIDYKDLYLYFSEEFDKEYLLSVLIQRRLNNEPISKIINRKSFWDYDFYVNGNVLDPRPDTENLIELVLSVYNTNKKLHILDMGTGSGCLILTLLKLFKNATGVAVDISEKALEVAKFNAKNLGVENINFVLSNWNDNVAEKFDIIVSNPPYIETEEIQKLDKNVKNFDPMLALDGGINGLKCYEYIAQNIIKNCKNNTKIFFEVGHNQAKIVTDIFEKNNFSLHTIKKDLNGYDRIVCFNVGEKNNANNG